MTRRMAIITEMNWTMYMKVISWEMTRVEPSITTAMKIANAALKMS